MGICKKIVVWSGYIKCRKGCNSIVEQGRGYIDKTLNEIEDRCSYTDLKDKKISRYRTYTRQIVTILTQTYILFKTYNEYKLI